MNAEIKRHAAALADPMGALVFSITFATSLASTPEPFTWRAGVAALALGLGAVKCYLTQPPKSERPDKSLSGTT